ncbi:hypothetical protein, partial [Urechidicola vernalis]
MLFLLPNNLIYAQDCSISGDDTVCIGVTETYSSEGGFSDFIWMVSGGGTISSGIGTDTIEIDWGLTTGDFTVSVSSASGSCSDSMIVTIRQKENAPNVTSPVTYCENALAVPLSTNSGGTFKWYDESFNLLVGAPTPDTSTPRTTSYYVSKEGNGNGCDSDLEEIEVIITDDTVDPVTPTLS